MSNSDFGKTSAITGSSICAVVTIVLKVFMMYNFWQDAFVTSGIICSFKNVLLYVLFVATNWTPIGLALMKYMGATFNFTISTSTIWLAIFCIVSEAFSNAFYKEYKKIKNGI